MVQPATPSPREVLAERVAAVPLARVELACVVLLFIAALLPRLRDISAPFDRGFDGEQGAFFAIAAVNYERGEAAGAYPVLNLDQPPTAEHRFVYANHPPLVPLLAWNAARLLGPQDWSEAWRTGSAPSGIELPMRLPFLAAQLLALLALWAAAREAYGVQVGLLTLGLGAASSVGIHYAGLVNYENPGLAAALLGVLFGLRWMRRGKRTDLALAGGATALGAAVTFTPLAFLPPLWIAACTTRGPRAASRYALVTAGCAAVPLVAHHFAAQAVLEGTLNPVASSIYERARILLGPLIAGEPGLFQWFAIQWRNAASSHGLWIVAFACSAALLRLVYFAVRRLRAGGSMSTTAPQSDRDLPLFPVLASGALLALFAFYKHTSEEQWSFQLWWLPAFSLGGALVLHAISRPLLALRAGLSPLVVLTLGLALPGLGTLAAWRARTRGDAALLPMPSATGHWIAQRVPARSVLLHDEKLGLNLAVGYYAWRTLWPLSAPDNPQGIQIATALGLGDQPRYWLSPAADSELERIAPIPAGLGFPGVADDKWRLWRVDGSATEDLQEATR